MNSNAWVFRRHQKRYIGRWGILLLSLAGLLFLSGCWDYREISDLAYVLAMGIDKAKEKDKVEVSVQIVKPGAAAPAVAGGGGGEESAVWVVSSTGYTVTDAFRSLALQLPREPNFTHCQVIVFGEDYAKEGVREALESFNRLREIRRRAWVMTAKGAAKKIMETEVELENVPANALLGMVERSGIASEASITMLNDFLRALDFAGNAAVMSRVELIEPPKPEASGGQGEGGAGGGAEQPPEKPRPRLTGTAVYKGDKLVGWLDRSETRGLLWLKGEFRRGIVVVDSPVSKEKVSLETIRASGRIVPRVSGESVSFLIRVDDEGDVAGGGGRKHNLLDDALIDSLQRRKAQVIRSEIETVVHKAQTEFRSDFLMLGETLKRRYPTVWQQFEDQWDEIFPTVSVDVDVRVAIRRTGLSL